MTIRRTLTAVLAATALIAPAAQAQPADMHASVAQAAAQERRAQEAQPKQDLRSPDARDAQAAQPTQDLRSPDARDASAPPADPTSRPAAGQPTWPVDPSPIPAPAQEPATDNDGSPVPVLPLVAGVLAVLATALAVRYGVRRTHRGARIAA